MWRKSENHRINFPMLFKILGWLLMIESACMFIPAAVAYFYGESDWIALGASAVFTFVVGFVLDHWINPDKSLMAKREGFLLTATVWVVFSLFGMLPFLFCSTPLGVVDAFFEAMAGFTTTGCSAYADIDKLSHGINIWRALMQWVGGMGIIIFTLAVIPMLNHSGGMQMFSAEVTGITTEKIRPRISQTAKTLWGIYTMLTIACFLLLWAGPMSFFDSICHAFGVVSTGGFSTHTESLHFWNSAYIDLVVTAFMLLGGTNFALIYFASLGKFKQIRENGTLKAYINFILFYYVVFVLVVIIRGEAHGPLTALVFPLFQVVSAMTSTGYLIPNFWLLGQFACALMLAMMFFGGCAGSTSGGAKIDRLVVVLKYLRNSLKRAFEPNKITIVKFDGRILPPDTVSRTIAFVCFYLIILLTGGLMLTMFDIPVFDSLLASLSCMSNSGLGYDLVMSDIGDAGSLWGVKLILSMLMLIGRLEVFTVLVLFLPNFWRK